MISAIGKLTNAVTMPTRTAPIVAPITGIRSKTKINTASGPAKGTPRIFRTMNEVTPAIVAVGSSTPDHVAAVAREVRARSAASPGAILVVGHSNTIPAIVHALGGPELPDLCDTKFAVLFALRLPDPGHAPARVERRVVGTPDAPVGDECAAMSPR